MLTKAFLSFEYHFWDFMSGITLFWNILSVCQGTAQQTAEDPSYLIPILFRGVINENKINPFKFDLIRTHAQHQIGFR